MKKTSKLILSFLLLIASASAFAFNLSSRDFGMGDNDTNGDSWDNKNPWSMSSGRWNTGRMGGNPFFMDSRDWGAAPWNFGNRNNSWGGRNNPWSGNTPWNWNSRDWRGSRGPWNRGNRGYGNSYHRGYYGDGYGNPYYGNPYNARPGPDPKMPYLPHAPSSPDVDLEKKQ